MGSWQPPHRRGKALGSLHFLQDADQRVTRASDPGGVRDKRDADLLSFLRHYASLLAMRRTLSGIEFELHCLRLFLRQGWDAVVTKGSGDQGADIIARKAGKTVVVQCKHYGSSVGNAAVQEVYAAKAHVRVDIACVVSNAQFTAGARQLAATTGVLLLNESALQDTNETFGIVIDEAPKITEARKATSTTIRCVGCGRESRIPPHVKDILCGQCGHRTSLI